MHWTPVDQAHLLVPDWLLRRLSALAMDSVQLAVEAYMSSQHHIHPCLGSVPAAIPVGKTGGGPLTSPCGRLPSVVGARQVSGVDCLVETLLQRLHMSKGIGSAHSDLPQKQA